MNDKKPEKMKMSRTDKIFIIFSVACVLLAAILQKLNSYISVSLFGLAFTGMSLFAAAQAQKKISYKTFYLYPLGIGVLMTVIPIILMFSDDEGKDILISRAIPTIAIGLFAYVGAVSVISVIIYNASKKKHCTESVSAFCVGLDRTKSGGHLKYAGIMKFSYNGQEYTVLEDRHTLNEYTSPNMKYNLRINPGDPEDVYLPKKRTDRGSVAGGILLIAVSVALMCVFIRWGV